MCRTDQYEGRRRAQGSLHPIQRGPKEGAAGTSWSNCDCTSARSGRTATRRTGRVHALRIQQQITQAANLKSVTGSLLAEFAPSEGFCPTRR